MYTHHVTEYRKIFYFILKITLVTEKRICKIHKLYMTYTCCTVAVDSPKIPRHEYTTIVPSGTTCTTCTTCVQHVQHVPRYANDYYSHESSNGILCILYLRHTTNLFSMIHVQHVFSKSGRLSTYLRQRFQSSKRYDCVWCQLNKGR